jgi:diguanylate cyclase (GGDEF)-like protein
MNQSPRFIQALHLLIPATLRQDKVFVFRAQNFLISAVLSVVLLPLYGLYYWVLGDQTAGLFCLAGGLVAMTTPLLLHLTGRLVLARELMLWTIFLVLLGTIYRVGGITGPVIIWLAVCPVVAMVSGGFRAGLTWGILSTGAITATYALTWLGVAFPPVQIRNMEQLHFVSSMGLVMVIATYLFIVETTITSTFRNLNEALRRMQEMAVTDELTGIFNRREILRLAEQERSRVERYAPSFTVCLIDLDHFKTINDTFGHAIGDEVLRQVTERIQRAIRKTDYLGRYGGEEFLLLLVDTDVQQAKAFVERLQELVRTITLAGINHQCITMSVGIAAFRRGESVSQMIARADAALYAAKENGRNRAMVDGDSQAMTMGTA